MNTRGAERSSPSAVIKYVCAVILTKPQRGLAPYFPPASFLSLRPLLSLCLLVLLGVGFLLGALLLTVAQPWCGTPRPPPPPRRRPRAALCSSLFRLRHRAYEGLMRQGTARLMPKWRPRVSRRLLCAGTSQRPCSTRAAGRSTCPRSSTSARRSGC